MSELNKQLQELESKISDIALIIDPCKMCRHHDEDKGYAEECYQCCWYYDSQFKVEGV